MMSVENSSLVAKEIDGNFLENSLVRRQSLRCRNLGPTLQTRHNPGQSLNLPFLRFHFTFYVSIMMIRKSIILKHYMVRFPAITHFYL